MIHCRLNLALFCGPCQMVLRGVSGYRDDLDKAMADIDRGIELDKDFAETYVNRGILHGLMGNPDRAIADYRTAL